MRLPDWVDLNPLPRHESSAFEIDALGQVNCGAGGPIYAIDSMLDSGASLASLYRSDLKALGIIKKHYSAQSLGRITLATGALTKQKMFEMYVEVDGNEGTPIVNPNNPIVPNRRAIGGIFPVLEIPETIKNPFDDESYLVNNRLSGMMPFLSSYVSVVPGSNVLLLGENRNDIIGHYKMPPFRVWDRFGSQDSRINPDFQYIENPNLYFEHPAENPAEKIIEKDHSRSAVEITKYGQTYIVDPTLGQT